MARCRIVDCVNQAGLPGSARGLCRAHYRRWQRYGDENAPLTRVQSWAGEICSMTGCQRPVKINGLCLNHYATTRRHYNREAQRVRNLEFKARFRAKQEQAMGRPRPLFCEVCQEPGYGRGNKPNAGICFDHDHQTGRPRGWLCDRCNKVLGLVRDDIVLLSKLIGYLGAADGQIDQRTA